MAVQIEITGLGATRADSFKMAGRQDDSRDPPPDVVTALVAASPSRCAEASPPERTRTLGFANSSKLRRRWSPRFTTDERTLAATAAAAGW
ncbi:MAG: hypothetical protein ABWY20_18190 [Mycobacterium sp.]